MFLWMSLMTTATTTATTLTAQRDEVPADLAAFRRERARYRQEESMGLDWRDNYNAAK